MAAAPKFAPSNGKSHAMAAYEIKPDFKLEAHEFDLNPLGDHDVELRLTHSGVCHSDIHSCNSDWGEQICPLVPGHELLGYVTQVGGSVNKFKVGDRVGVGPQAFSCGECKHCRNHKETRCEKGFIGSYGAKLPNGYVTRGGYSVYNRTNENFVFRIPDNLDSAGAAPLLCAGVTVFTPMKKAGVKEGSKVAINGIGGLGHIAVRLAKALGAEVTAVSTSNNKKDEALKELGADHFLISKFEKDSAEEKEFKAHWGTFDVVINTVSADLEWMNFIKLATPDTGHFVQLGAPPAAMALPASALVFTGVNIWGSLIGSPQDFEDMFAVCEKHNIVCKVETVPLAEVNDAVEKVLKNTVRYRMVLLMPEEEVKA